jgi:hypothetical protein
MNNMQPSLAMNYYVNERGVFPPRDGGPTRRRPVRTGLNLNNMI